MDNKEQIKILNSKINDFKEKLTDAILDCNAVYITSHRNPDFDAIASMGAMALICKKFKKSPYIVIDAEDYEKLPFRESDMLEKIRDKFVVINMDDYNDNKLENSLLITLDVNKGFRTPFKNNYNDFNKIFIIDHHKEDEDTIQTRNKLILSKEVSSCSEMLFWLLRKYKVKPSINDYYAFLLVGIYLDTKQKNKNMYPSTYDCISELTEILSDDEILSVESYFSRDWEEDMKLHELMQTTVWKTHRYAITIGSENAYTREQVAKVADQLLEYNRCEASIVCGRNTEGSYYVSARSNRGNIDIVHLMRQLNGGGGHMGAASCDPIFVDDAVSKEEEKKILYDRIFDMICHREIEPFNKRTLEKRYRYRIKGRKQKQETKED